MGFTSRNRPPQQAKEVSPQIKAVSKENDLHKREFTSRIRSSQQATPRMKTVSKDNSPQNQSKNDLRVKEAGSDQPHQKDDRSLSSQKMIKVIKNDQKMGFTGRNRSSQQVKEVSLRMKAVSKASNPHSQSKNNLRVKKAGMGQAQQKKTTSNFQEQELKGTTGAEDQISFIDSLSEDSDYMWLSSDSLSSSLVSSDDSQDVWDLNYLNLFLQGGCSSMTSLSGSSDVSLDTGNESFVSDGSKSIPISEVSSVLSSQLGFGWKDVEELIQLEAFGNEGKDSSVALSESCNSSKRTLFEYPSISESSFALPRTYMSTPLRDFDRIDIWVSSLDLEREDSELIWDREKEFDIFDSDFPSPSFSAMQHRQIQFSSSSSLNSVGQKDKVQSVDTDSDEPLLWPFDHSLYIFLDLEKFLCPSPRKDERDVGAAGSCTSKLTRSRLSDNNPQTNRKGTQKLSRRITFSPTPKPVTTECKTRAVGYGAQKIVPMPSRLSRSTKAPSHQHLCSISKRRGRPPLKIDA